MTYNLFKEIWTKQSYAYSILTLKPDSWKFIMASEMLTSNGKITFSTLKGPTNRSDKSSMDSETNKQ